MVAHESLYVDTVSSSGMTPLFYLHDWDSFEKRTLPEAEAVIACTALIENGTIHHALLLVMECGLIYSSEAGTDYTLCTAPSCSVRDCTRATASTAPAGAHEAEYPVPPRHHGAPRACAACGARDVQFRPDADDLVCADWPACQARQVVGR